MKEKNETALKNARLPDQTLKYSSYTMITPNVQTVSALKIYVKQLIER